MRDHRPTLTQTLISESRFSQLQEHAAEIMTINNALRDILPKGTANQCRAANLRGGNLVIEVASASIKMKINYDRLMILSQLRNMGFARLIGLEVKINPALYRTMQEKHENKEPSRPPISDAAAGSLLMIAEMAPPKIKARLEKIAQMAEKNK
ncbi:MULTISPECIES: DUF721 domain-containing protein [Vibrio]|uniref:DUF721 domain-containing protein n=2 Tax=Vibrio TaxID=662 RepID=A0A1E5D7Y5_9VIBR|nr:MULTISPECIES: DciA family protein [Vibrio]MDN3699515.1 DciA family protein [Vibrio cortegadensis]NOH83518.1 DUF721 domain-containing protein [Vibrio sp. 03-59-1]OEE79787.1 hypothetical protein A130_01540 [Vibrio genomosp. F6 str. FF-238]RBW63935.1 DUF721 domain-containing protein [Vibrionales bacterium C3R12]